jgi:hypothetical protein
MSMTGLDLHAEGTWIQPQRVTILNVDLLMFELWNITKLFEAPLRFIMYINNVCSVGFIYLISTNVKNPNSTATFPRMKSRLLGYTHTLLRFHFRVSTAT